MKALFTDQGFIFITALLAVAAYACTGYSAFPSLASRMRGSVLFFAVMETAFVLFAWDTIHALWVSN